MKLSRHQREALQLLLTCRRTDDTIEGRTGAALARMGLVERQTRRTYVDYQGKAQTSRWYSLTPKGRQIAEELG